MTFVRRRVRAWLLRVPGALLTARVVLETIRVCLRYRVTGLAAELGFFALLSFPPLVLGLFGGLGYVGDRLGPQTVHDVRGAIEGWAANFLTPELISQIVGPTIDDVLLKGRIDLISVGFVLSLWSGSRALNVMLDTVSIMYGQADIRGIVPTRALSFTLYTAALLIGTVTVPLLLIGPSYLGRILPSQVSWLVALYWPVVVLLVVVGLAGLFHIATPVRAHFGRDVPGAVLALVLWVIASFVVRGVISSSLQGGTSIYGPLSAPIVVLIWCYFLAIAVLIGAAFNAALRAVWPYAAEGTRLHESIVAWFRGHFVRPRRAPEQADPEDPFDAYESLDLDGLLEAAQGPLTPVMLDPDERDDEVRHTTAARG